MDSHPTLDALLDRAEGLLPASGRALLGIAGLPGAGKTTLAVALTAGLSGRLGPGAVAHVPMDGFHLADVQLDRLGLVFAALWATAYLLGRKIERERAAATQDA